MYHWISVLSWSSAESKGSVAAGNNGKSIHAWSKAFRASKQSDQAATTLLGKFLEQRWKRVVGASGSCLAAGELISGLNLAGLSLARAKHVPW